MEPPDQQCCRRFFRRKVLEALGSNLYDELAYTERMAIIHPKNYQIWHHRREICSMLQDGSAEKAFSAKALSEDTKNYHAWAHRQWAVRTFGLWDGELAFIDEMLADDIRNNSAWNHRWFVLKHTTPLGVVDRKREAQYALDKIAVAIHNESPWNYLRGLVRGHEVQLISELKPKLLTMLEEHSDCIFVAGFLVDVYAHEGTEEAVQAAHVVRGGSAVKVSWVANACLPLYCSCWTHWPPRRISCARPTGCFARAR